MELQKYTPNDICRILGISKSTLLWWESQNYIPRSHRSLNLRRSRWWDKNQVTEIADWHYYRKTKLTV